MLQRAAQADPRDEGSSLRSGPWPSWIFSTTAPAAPRVPPTSHTRQLGMPKKPYESTMAPMPTVRITSAGLRIFPSSEAVTDSLPGQPIRLTLMPSGPRRNPSTVRSFPAVRCRSV